MTETAIAVQDRPAPNLLTDLRGTIMLLDVPTMQGALTEFTDRRNAFRLWLCGQMRQGVHFGFPPGCKPASTDPKQWEAKPSLYKAGADFLCELMGWRSTFENDVTTWEMLGKPECICLKAFLWNSEGKEVGQGRGARRKGEKSMEINATIKMAEKCAKVDAVINALSLSDLFTQDIEDLKPRHENPTADESQPKQKPRSERVRSDEIKAQSDLWKSNNRDAGFEEWSGFVHKATGVGFDPRKPEQWTRKMLDDVKAAISYELTGQLPN